MAKKVEPAVKKKTSTMAREPLAETLSPQSYQELMSLSGFPAEVGKHGFLLNQGSGGSIVELCAGSCRLSKALLDAQAQDGQSNFTIECFEYARAKEEDIVLPANRASLLERIRKREILALWCGPPCATWSRARRGKKKTGQTKHWPLPLRDDDKNIEGLFGTMTAREASRVREANDLGKFLAQLAAEAAEQGIMMILENPTRSRFWKYGPVAQQLNLRGTSVRILISCFRYLRASTTQRGSGRGSKGCSAVGNVFLRDKLRGRARYVSFAHCAYGTPWQKYTALYIWGGPPCPGENLHVMGQLHF